MYSQTCRKQVVRDNPKSLNLDNCLLKRRSAKLTIGRRMYNNAMKCISSEIFEELD